MPDTLLGGLIISEILADPNGTENFDTDGDGSASLKDEFIELRNVSDAAIDISGLELWDSAADNWFTFPPGTVLDPMAHAVVVVDISDDGSLPSGGPNDLAFDANRTFGNINNSGGNIVVYDPAHDNFIQAAHSGGTIDDPTSNGGYSGFSSTATRSGSGENFGASREGNSIQRGPGSGDNFYNDRSATPGARNVCYCAGTRIKTDTGYVCVEDIHPGQSLCTVDTGLDIVKWASSRTISVSELQQTPELRPVVIPQGALGVGLPVHELRVSQQHRILVGGKIARRMFGTSEVLVPAKSLVGMNGVRVCNRAAPVCYYHIALSRHAIVLAEGAPAESFYPGREALRALSHDALTELLMIFPDLMTGTPKPARMFARTGKGEQLVIRHIKNDRPLLSRNDRWDGIQLQ